MKLRELLKDVSYELVQGNLEVEVSDIAYDSRKVNETTAFVALKGFRVDGHEFIDAALELGCKVVIVSDDVVVKEDITVIKLEDFDQYFSISVISTLKPPLRSQEAAGKIGSTNKHKIIIRNS